MNSKLSLHFILTIVLLGSATLANAQTAQELTPDETLWDQQMAGSAKALYYADLSAGEWRVTVRMTFRHDLNLKIEVSLNINMTEIVGRSESSAAVIITQFTLESAEVVYIQLEDTSGNSGVYSISLSGDETSGTDAITSITPNSTMPISQLLAVIVILLVSVGAAGIALSKVQFGGSIAEGFFRFHEPPEREKYDDFFKMKRPDYALPERYDRKPESPAIRIALIPSKCPFCGVSFSSDDIDWVGPLEIACGYCGSTIKVHLERD